MLCSSLLGSIPIGYIIFRIKKKDDIRNYGSGNIGATNVNRLIGKKFAAFTLFFDLFKSLICCYLSNEMLGNEIAKLCGFLCILGHIYPIWLKFRGGKGVASFIGYLSFISWPLALIFIFIWFVTVKLFKISAIGAVTSLIFNIMLFKFLLFIQFNYSSFLWIPGEPLDFYFILITTIIILFRHKNNLKSILK